MTNEQFRPLGVWESRSLGKIVVYTDPETPSGANWLAVGGGA